MVKEKKTEEDLGPPYLTIYERTRIIGIRTEQLEAGAKPLLKDIPENIKDPKKIAELELEAGVLPILIERVSSSGRRKIIPLKKLLKK
ncbi:MAG: DNA-directed RNA polymerase subunit K [Thermoproteota archaeon]|nr:MAG: DNA-directed RNA polymerase subunit K [Candidatus Korarchaeota archaeon]